MYHIIYRGYIVNWCSFVYRSLASPDSMSPKFRWLDSYKILASCSLVLILLSKVVVKSDV